MPTSNQLNNHISGGTGGSREEENAPLLQMILRQKDLQAKQEERHQVEMRLQKNEIEKSMKAMKEDMMHLLRGERRSDIKKKQMYGEIADTESIAHAHANNSGRNGEDFIDDFGSDVSHMSASTTEVGSSDSTDLTTARSPRSRGTAEAQLEKKASFSSSWLYDLGGNDEKVVKKVKKKGACRSITSSSTTTSVARTYAARSEERRSLHYGDVDENVIGNITSRNSENMYPENDEEELTLKDQAEEIELLKETIEELKEQVDIAVVGSTANRRGSTIFRTSFSHTKFSSDNNICDHQRDSLDADTFSMMTISKVGSLSWMLGAISFCFEMIFGSMIAINQFRLSTSSSTFDVPFKVDAEVRVVQFLTIIVALSIQTDILTSIRTFFLLGYSRTNWMEVIGVEESYSATGTLGIWLLRIAFPNTLKLVQGLTVTFVSFVIIVQAQEIIGLLKDFTALTIISEIDNVLYGLAVYGYLGEQLRCGAVKVEEVETPKTLRGKAHRELAFVRLTFFLLLGVMFGGWGVIFYYQMNGIYFERKFPGCVNYDLALDHFGDGKCYGGTLNTIECKFEGGDCVDFNTEFPGCKGKGREGFVNVEDEIGNDKCNMNFAIPECDYDGGDCCSYDIQRSPNLGDGQCHSGLISTEGCEYDGGDCSDFVALYGNCKIDSGANEIILGDGICDGGGYTTEVCGYEYGDCDVGQIGGDMIFSGIVSPSDSLHFTVKMSTDGSKIIIAMPYTDKDGKFNKNAPGRIMRFTYDDEALKWVEWPNGWSKNLEAENVSVSRLYFSNGGSVVAVGSPQYNGNIGRVAVYQLDSQVDPQILDGVSNITVPHYHQFGYKVDLTDDGMEMVISSPGYDVPERGGFKEGRVQIFKFDPSEQLWTQLGDNIYGKVGDYIGEYSVRIISLNVTRVFFDTNPSPVYDYSDRKYGVSLRAYEYAERSEQWIQLGGDIDIQKSIQPSSSNVLLVSADGNRLVQSVQSDSNTRATEVKIFDLVPNPASSRRSWIELVPAILLPFQSENEDTNAGGLGHSMSMSADGNFLVISSYKSGCIILDNASSDLCATGLIQMYQYKSTNPPHRLFSLLPYKRDDSNFLSIMEEAHQEKDGTILGLHLSLNGDGTRLSISGIDLGEGKGFLKVYTVSDLFYADCIVKHPELIGNGQCNTKEPYYTESCGFDGNDCPVPSSVDGFDGCDVADPKTIGDNRCDDNLPNICEQCGFDNGDCPPPLSVKGYPDCFVSRPHLLGNGSCDDYLPYNGIDCNFDGGDCLPKEFTLSPTIPSSLGPSMTPQPSVSARPTTLDILVHFQLRTDKDPSETSWYLVDGDGTKLFSGPGDEERYDANTLYRFPWTLKRCTFYTLTVNDRWGDGFASSGYAGIILNGDKGGELLGRIEGRFGEEESIDINMCGPTIAPTTNPSTSFGPSVLPSSSQSLSPSSFANPAQAQPSSMPTQIISVQGTSIGVVSSGSMTKDFTIISKNSEVGFNQIDGTVTMNGFGRLINGYEDSFYFASTLVTSYNFELLVYTENGLSAEDYNSSSRFALMVRGSLDPASDHFSAVLQHIGPNIYWRARSEFTKRKRGNNSRGGGWLKVTRDRDEFRGYYKSNGNGDFEEIGDAFVTLSMPETVHIGLGLADYDAGGATIDFSNFSCRHLLLPTSTPSVSTSPSIVPSIDSKPSITTRPTGLNIFVHLELHTDKDPNETTWSLINMDDDKVVDRSKEYNWLNDREKLFNDSTWNLNRCTSYKFTIFDSFGDGFSMPGYAKITLGGGTDILGRVDGDFGTESSIEIYVCGE